MKLDEIIAFLLPGSDPIQTVFGASILLLMTLTMAAVWFGATPSSWEKKWNGGTHDDASDDLDVEHGSVNEISAAVATTGEKMADIMPGILLILGLLGTFLGLGIALNKASTILVEANAGGGMDSAMANLMGMMEGLGTKFKTSTWGITAFLLLKAWAAKNGYEERRLRWCVGKMKAAFEHSRQEQKRERLQSQQAVIDALAKIDQSLLSQMEANRQLLDLQCKLSKHGNATVTNALDATRQAVENLQQAVLPQIQTLNATSLDTNKSLTEANTHLHRHSEQNQQLLDDGQATRNTLEQFVEANSRNLGAISQAATQMAEAASDVGQSAGQLQTAIDGFKVGVADVLGNLQQDLGSTIDLMGKSFAQNMDGMAATMADATTGISTAVADLSDNVGRTMESVQQSNSESVAIQKNAQAEFLVTSETLNENVEAMTNLVNALCGDIKKGLQAVSESGRRMADVNTRYQDVTEEATRSAAAIEKLVAELQAMQHSSPLQPAMDAVTGRVELIGHSLQQVNEHLQSLRTTADNGRHRELHEALEQVIGQLRSLALRADQSSVSALEA
ncbi:methyl-accepting chemotaxis protein [Metapseudomonas lalkuanensis]|uniref:methyl-accepting chemotaxis protein n=1 Tax=Metapseudomonas lalkuanensis TaxID=2604832 RepID=UPI001CF55716|nr:methyl-accepting chemotaxis protein [Pseudomonas lalkuanensis]UCO96411.1 methyl-accepting chemotaxis protein [Pseudomonas lalkuanensis]